jgi:glutathione S-transferase
MRMPTPKILTTIIWILLGLLALGQPAARAPGMATSEVLGAQAAAADAALFYVEFWAAGRLNMKLPPNCAAHYERMKARPAVQRTLEAEAAAGYNWTQGPGAPRP